MKQFIVDERFVNIQKAQSGLTKLFLEAQKNETFYRVLRNDQALGVLIPENLWRSLTEDLEALSSPSYLRRIARARMEKKTVKTASVKKLLGL
ncbi:hypothetical protein KKE78_02225 [Patescibacteria group bacterium]|nr:hypothetical protein [Patescibacteria group bacterium]